MAKDQKRNAIIGAALKRFTHFGVGKTTMTEIADDLALSKASLYYYFPDKLNLYAAVLQDIIEEDATRHPEYYNEKDPLKSVLLYLESRTEFIIKYYNILEHLRTLSRDVPKELEPVFSTARTREKKILTTILTNANNSKILTVTNATSVAELFLDCLEGLRYNSISRKAHFFPDKKQFQAILKEKKSFPRFSLKD